MLHKYELSPVPAACFCLPSVYLLCWHRCLCTQVLKWLKECSNLPFLLGGWLSVSHWRCLSLAVCDCPDTCAISAEKVGEVAAFQAVLHLLHLQDITEISVAFKYQHFPLGFKWLWALECKTAMELKYNCLYVPAVGLGVNLGLELRSGGAVEMSPWKY